MMKQSCAMTAGGDAALYARLSMRLVAMLLMLLAGCSTSNLDRAPHAWPDEEALGYAPNRQALLRAIRATLGSHGYQLRFANAYQVRTEWRAWYPEAPQRRQGLMEGRDRFTIRIVPEQQTRFAAYLRHECEVQVQGPTGATRSRPCVMKTAYASIINDVRFRLDRQFAPASWR